LSSTVANSHKLSYRLDAECSKLGNMWCFQDTEVNLTDAINTSLECQTHRGYDHYKLPTIGTKANF